MADSTEVALAVLSERFAALEKSVIAANAVLDDRLKSLDQRLHSLDRAEDELRSFQMTSISREECKQCKSDMEKELKEFGQFKAAVDAKASQTSVYVAWFFAAVGAILGVISVVVSNI